MNTVKVKKLVTPRGGGLSDGWYNIELRRMTWGDVQHLLRALESRESLTKLGAALEAAVNAADSIEEGS